MSLFVGNIPLTVSSAELLQLFGKMGSCQVDLKTGKKPVQFAVVTYNSDKEAHAAVDALNETSLQGNVIRVRYSGSNTAAQQRERSRSPDRAGKNIIQLKPTATVTPKVINLQAEKLTTPTVIQLSGPKTSVETKPVTGIVHLGPAPPAAVPGKSEEPKPVQAPPPEPAKPAETKVPETKPEPKKPTPAVLPPVKQPPPPSKPVSSVPPPAQTPPPQTVPAKPAAKVEETKAEEEVPDIDGFISVPDRPDEVKCIPCGKILKKAARKAHVTSKAHIKNKDSAKA